MRYLIAVMAVLFVSACGTEYTPVSPGTDDSIELVPEDIVPLEIVDTEVDAVEVVPGEGLQPDISLTVGDITLIDGYLKGVYAGQAIDSRATVLGGVVDDNYTWISVIVEFPDRNKAIMGGLGLTGDIESLDYTLGRGCSGVMAFVWNFSDDEPVDYTLELEEFEDFNRVYFDYTFTGGRWLSGHYDYVDNRE